METPTIFVVDDQESIRTTLEAILIDERYRIRTFADAEALHEAVASYRPNLILLDIWLPGTDGIEALKVLKRNMPEVPVILMSGHAGIDVAVRGMKLGAADFLEKPLNLAVLLDKISQVLAGTPTSQIPTEIGDAEKNPNLQYGEEGGAKAAVLVPSTRQQRTIRANAVMNGVGLMSGRPTGIIISPMPTGSGIVFRTLDGETIPAHLTSLENFARFKKGHAFTANSTVLAKGKRRVRTVEHLLAALNMLGITNAQIKVDEEIPNVDGSAADFCRIIADAGIKKQDMPAIEVVIQKKISVGEESPEKKHVYVEPYDGFEVVMRVDYPAPIFEQKLTFNPARDSFERDIAPARSFNTFENIDLAQKSGLVGSGYLNSHIIIHDGKVINTELNFPDEFVRHKILDLIGDFYLLGNPLRGRVVANMTSHGLNHAMAVKIHEALSS